MARRLHAPHKAVRPAQLLAEVAAAHPAEAHRLRAVNDLDFALVDAGQRPAGFDGAALGLVVTDDCTLTDAEWQALVAAHTPVVPVDEQNAGAIAALLAAAVDANKAYLGIGVPTAAQVAQQVRALTRQLNGLLRLQRGLLDVVD